MFGKFEVIASDDVLLTSVLQHGRISWNTRWGNLDGIKVEIVHEGSNTDAIAALNTEWIQGISDSDSEDYDSEIPQWGRLRRLDDDAALQYRYLSTKYGQIVKDKESKHTNRLETWSLCWNADVTYQARPSTLVQSGKDTLWRRII